jgi:phosphoribosylformylglycinamidine synthase I
MADVNVLLLRTAGTNCDLELARAFELCGAKVERIHINRILADTSILQKFQILGFPGGFSYGDDIASGKILANQIIHHLKAPLTEFIAAGKLVIGICNGFQVLVKCGLLPGPIPQLAADDTHPTTLTYNLSGRFEDRWVELATYSKLCKWIPAGQRVRFPVAHGEGRFAVRNEAVLAALQGNDQVVLRYVDAAGQPTQTFPANPNGSVDAIAGICDITGQILGLMPHPERIIDTHTAPDWTRNAAAGPDGLLMFQTAVKYVQEHLLTAAV